MSGSVPVKICGLRSRADMDAAATAGARYVGLNFFAKSKRFVDPETAQDLAAHAPLGLAKVGLVVDADDTFLDVLVSRVPLDILQLHGHETTDRVAAVKARYGLPVLKAVGVAEERDLAHLDAFESVADMLLVDAKPPKNGVLPGGNGLTFDWRLIAGRPWKKPWLLAGGLTPMNVATAIAATGAGQVDVASGVETAPGQKSPELMAAFVSAAQPR